MLHLPLSFPGWEDDLLSDFMAMPGYTSCRGSACAAPRLYRPAAAATPTFRVLRAAPAFPEPEEPEVYIRRTEEGVLAVCPLGHGFCRDDISLELEGRDLTITAWHPQTRHWRAYGRERPAAYQRTLELAPHIDAQRMKARLDAATGSLELFFPYRRVAPAPQPRPRVVVVQQSAVAVPVPPAAAPRPSLVRAPAPAAVPAPRSAPAPAPPAAVAAPAVTPAAKPEADDAVAMAQRSHRRRQRHYHMQQRRRSCSPKQAEPACPTCCCQAPSPTPAAPASQPQQRQQQCQPKPQQRVIPIECTEPSTSAAAAKAQRSRPSSPAAVPVASPRSAAASPSTSPAASPKAAGKGKSPASPEQVAQWQRQQRAATAAKRIAAGMASDSDWEDADGSVSECGLDD